MRVEVAVDIGAPIQRVWHELERLDRHVEWMADARSITFRTPQHAGTGTELDCVTRVGPFVTTDRLTVTAWDPPTTIGIEHRGAVTGRGELRAVTLPHDATRVSWVEDLAYPWWLGGRLGERVSHRVLERLWRRNLFRLAAIVERG